MSFVRRHPGFVAVVALLVVAGIAFVALAVTARDRALDLARQVRMMQVQLDGLALADPAPTEANREAAAANRDRLRERYDRFSTQLRRQSEAGGALVNPHGSSQDLYFDLVQFVERQRAAFEAAGIRIPSGEEFGFALYLGRGSGPREADLAPVHRQHVVLDRLLASLLAVRPQGLVAVEREAVTAEERPDPAARTPAAPGPDLFSVAPEVSARVAGAIDAVGYRLVFDAQTETLRGFLTAVADLPLSLVVRGVEVAAPREPDPRARQRNGARRAGAAEFPFGVFDSPESGGNEPEPVPIVEENLSRFTVTIEHFSLVDQAATAVPESPGF